MSIDNKDSLLTKLKTKRRDDLDFGLIYFALTHGYNIEKISSILHLPDLTYEVLQNKKNNLYLKTSALVSDLKLSKDEIEDIMDVNDSKTYIVDVSSKSIKEVARNIRILSQIEKIFDSIQDLEKSNKYVGSTKIIENIEKQIIKLASNSKKDFIFFLKPPKNDYFKNNFDSAYSKLEIFVSDYLSSINVEYSTQNVLDWMKDVTDNLPNIDYSVPNENDLNEIDSINEGWESEIIPDDVEWKEWTSIDYEDYEDFRITFDLNDDDMELIRRKKSNLKIFYINWYEEPKSLSVGSRINCSHFHWLAQKEGQYFIRKIITSIINAQKANKQLVVLEFEKVTDKESSSLFFQGKAVKFFSIDNLVCLFTNLGYTLKKDKVSANLFKLHISF